ncbi:lytic transglycosylase domain-containing protein [Caballeronia sp. LZ008]|uniref:lytic transglycosylase domain-containing protein n=1 Tax=Caballeronia sp. LZ008 TaxID=3038560 RepID=UPI00285C11B7|nr:lytic transglycosylase domain-containing protein [Caballeronia sp. LZ008]MDR5797991.1 lytic transglycosylase domain-containing protein [Caballeronia sp. LZ008]
MQARDTLPILATAGVLLVFARFACAKTTAPSLPFDKLAAECAPGVHPTTLKGVVRTESAGNPFVIGVVGGRLERQPRNLAEAVATARELERQGFNFSMGLGQVNRYNLAKYGERYETIFEPCRNLQAGSAILRDCYQRARATIPDDQQALRAAFSCYYSGNFTRGFRPDRAGQRSYVQKVVANATDTAEPIPVVPAVKPDSADASAKPQRAASQKPAKRTATATQWVMFADGPLQRDQAPDSPVESANRESTVKVRLATPAKGASDKTNQTKPVPTSASREMQPVSVQRSTTSTSTTSTTQQAAPFVQFVN